MTEPGTPQCSSKVREQALVGYDAGLCPIPPRLDGSKAPFAEWKGSQSQRPTRDAAAKRYSKGCPGLGTLTGKVSGHRECLELDDEASRYEAFKEVAQVAGLSELVERIEAGYLERPPLWRDSMVI